MKKWKKSEKKNTIDSENLNASFFVIIIYFSIFIIIKKN